MKLTLLCYIVFHLPYPPSFSPLLTLTFIPPSLSSPSLLPHSPSSHAPLFSYLPFPLLLSSSLFLYPLPLPPLSYQGKSVPVLCLEGFSQLLQTVNTRYPHKMETFLTSVNPTIEEDTSRNDRVHFFVRHFQVHMKWR